MAEYTMPYFLEYSNRWGYPFYFFHSYKYVKRKEDFKFKLRLIERYFAYCEWVAWFDSDIIFTNFTVPLESFIDTRYEFLAAGPSQTGNWSLNAGALFVHDSEWTRALFAQAYALHTHDDQAALQYYLRQPTNFAKSKIIPWKALQQPYEPGNRTGRWSPGDFCVHFWGWSKALVQQFVVEQIAHLNDEKDYPFEAFELGKYRNYKPLPN